MARVHTQIDRLKREGITNIASGYVEGIYTQDNLLKRIPDGINGYTFESRVETAYYQFCEQARDWLEDPGAQIRVMGIGFSRGAEQTAALMRMIEERGIQDPEDAKLVFDENKLITHAEYTKPPLVHPGKTIQAALLLDPVATGLEEHDRRLPASVMSILQVTAADERRDLFKSSDHIPAGFSEDARALNVTVSGAHSDIGNTYALDGMGVLSYNLVSQYINRLSDTPILQARMVPEDRDLYRVHRSDQHAFFYGTRGFDADGLRDHVNHLGSEVQCRVVEARECISKDPMSPELDQQLERRTAAPSLAIELNAKAAESEKATTTPRSDLDRMIDQLYAASLSGNDADWQRAKQTTSQQFMASPQGQAWQVQVDQYRQAQRAQQAELEAQQRREQALQRQQEAPAHQAPAMQM